MIDKPPPQSASNPKRPFFVGVDLGGTNIKVGVLDDVGETLFHHSIPTETHKGPEDGTSRMAQAVRDAVRQAGLAASDIKAVGLGSPGTMDIPAGLLLEPHNLPGWFNFPIRQRLAEASGYPVYFANDGAAAAYGEYWVGSGRDYQSLIMLTLGTGVGGGILIGDVSIDGQNSHGAECGHIIIDSRDDARICPCGQRGHLEGYASATAVISRAQEALAAGAATSARRRLASGEKLTPLLLAEEAEAGDPFSLELILETARYLGIGIVTLLHVIDPQVVVLGGAMTFGGSARPLGRQFLERVKLEVRHRAFPVLAGRIEIKFATLGGNAGYIGAAGLARLRCRTERTR